MESGDDIREKLRKQRERWLRERDIDKEKKGNLMHDDFDIQRLLKKLSKVIHNKTINSKISKTRYSLM